MKNNPYLIFLRNYLLFSLVFLGLIFTLNLFPVKEDLFLIALLDLGFVFIITLISGFSLVFAMKRSHLVFMSAISGGTLIKILFSLLFIYFMIKTFEGKVIEIVLVFFLLYSFFTVFEVYQLLYNLRPIFKGTNEREKP